jgi:hypothetical protein
MRPNILALSFALTSLCMLSQSELLAQGSQNYYRPPSSFAGKTVVLPIGTTFEGRIQSTIGSHQSRSGESFSVEVSAPVLANGTEVIIPSGSEVIGEVAEAMSSSSQAHDKNRYAPMGILRVQLTSIRFPDGQAYPLVASFAPDGSRSRAQGGLTARKSSVAYVGSQAGFDAVNPALHPRNRGQQGRMQVMSKGEIMSDPILGDTGNSNSTNGTQIRSLMRKGRELMILRGSPMTIRLDSPLKIALGSSSVPTNMESSVQDQGSPMPSGKHFSKSRKAQQQAHEEQGEAMTAAPPGAQGAPPAAGGYQQQGGQPPVQQQGYNPQQQQGGQAPVEQPGSSF